MKKVMKNDKLDKIEWEIGSPSLIKSEYLRTFPYEYKGKNITVKIETKEFCAVCPWSGLPDFGMIMVEYIPRELVLELKSFKYYLYTFRHVGIFQEHALNRIFEDLLKVLKPKKMRVTLKYNIRGGMETTTVREK
ncbi:MAG: NADPH-dependent 7-cyano-7-deazaguanine reductase QueF [Spirochaetes bacterium]|nr:NADPH-dependent 7-cyano-7-deazaguanine reductase QueF [Spirochaetota bacterium]